ncbi:unnamed protein product [Meloidogyne enterolobii]|uniref:Uncharacterized protein n=1 Tax=Meloidogyne enterolobii TaxID=390850 RepID=A0ACB1B3V4_MELEN
MEKFCQMSRKPIRGKQYYTICMSQRARWYLSNDHVLLFLHESVFPEHTTEFYQYTLNVLIEALCVYSSKGISEAA